LHGIPGCGKTILSSTRLENVFQYCADDPGRVVSYFYFDFNDAEKHSPELMVRSLICQLSAMCQDTYMSLSKWQKDPHIRDEIETALIKGPHGMYAYTLISLRV
jgi:hypothetical protein